MAVQGFGAPPDCSDRGQPSMLRAGALAHGLRDHPGATFAAVERDPTNAPRRASVSGDRRFPTCARERAGPHVRVWKGLKAGAASVGDEATFELERVTAG